MANTCSATLTAIELSCEGSAGGIKRVLVAPRTSIHKPTPASDVIKIGDIKANASGVKFVEYAFRPETGSLTFNSAVDTAIGSSSCTSDLALQFTRMEQTKRVAIQQAINTGSVALVQDFNGAVWYLGYDMPGFASEATGQTGQALSDLNGFTLNLQFKSFELPYMVKGTDGTTDATDDELDALLTAVPVVD